MEEFVQPSLFAEFNFGRGGPQTLDLQEWSPSKRNQLEQCPRKYYYQYYGNAADVMSGHPASLKFYRKLSNSWMLAGILLHLKIREVFGIWRKGETLNHRSFLQETAQRWQRVRENSVQFERSGNYAQPPTAVLLSEFVFRQPFAQKIWREAGERLERALFGFLTLPKLERFRQGGLADDAAIEKSVRVNGRGFRMRGKIDLAWRENGRVTVADWKSGDREGADSDLQLLAYALGVQQHFGCELEELDLFRVELGSGKPIPLSVNDREAARAKARMAQDTRLMIDLHKYGSQGSIEAFTPTGSPRICSLCPYQRICPGSEA